MPDNAKIDKPRSRDSFSYLIGSFLYNIGLQTEYTFVKIARAVFGAIFSVGHIFKWIWATIITHAKPFFMSVTQEIFAPWNQAVSGFKNIKDVMVQERRSSGGESALKEGRAYLARGVKLYKGTLIRALAYLLPIAALVLLTFTVRSVLNTTYALSVSVGGERIGFIENEKVYSDAMALVQSRIKANTTGRKFDIETVLNVTSVSKEALSSKTQLADAIINASGNDVTEGVGYMLDGVLIGVTTDGTAVQAVLDAAKAPMLDSSRPNMRVEFIRDLSVQTGVYFTDTIENAQYIVDRLNGNAPYTASDGTQHTENLLSVKQIERVTIERTVPFEKVSEKDSTLEWGTETVSQEGVDGLEQAVQDITYIEGMPVSTQDIEVITLSEAVPEITLYGVQSAYGEAGDVGTGTLIWPVPDYKGVSRGKTYYHRGLDITGKEGTPILAADNGIVEFAGSGSGTANWSYGNYVHIDHGNGMTTIYGHMIAVNCKTGQYVKQGDVIGYLGSTGLSTGNHCHFEVIVNKVLQDPYNYVQRPS